MGLEPSSPKLHYLTSDKCAEKVYKLYMLKFRQIVEEAKTKVGGRQTLAIALNVTPARITRVCRGDDYTLNIENCLRLAAITARHPSEVLIAAGKEEIAKLIESLYGEGRNDQQSAAAVAKIFQLQIGYLRLIQSSIAFARQGGDPAAIAALINYLPDEDRQGMARIIPLLFPEPAATPEPRSRHAGGHARRARAADPASESVSASTRRAS